MTRLLSLLIAICLSAALFSFADSQPRHRIHRNMGTFELEEIATGVKRPFDMWITRLANALFTPAYTDEIISNLDDYRRYGINTILVSIHGGGLGGPKYPKVYNTDGTLDLTSPVWSSLAKILEETDKRGMVVQLQYWYFLRINDVPLDADAVIATENVSKWLKNTGYEHVILDVVNEYAHLSHTRPLFNTLQGALEIIRAVRKEHPSILLGISPPSRLFFPAGTLGSQTYGADYIIGHNQIQNPAIPGAYWFNTKPTTPSDYPYVNNEFWHQIAYERSRRLNPRTNKMSYGHFSPALVSQYVGDLTTLRGFNGYGGIHTRYQQHVAPGGVTPVSFVGPEGTQPELTPGGGEPSVHWLYKAVSGMQNRGPIPLTLDFDEWASGFEAIDGTWTVNNSEYQQTDAARDPAWTRIAVDGDDLEIAFALRFLADPGAGAAGIMLGAATPAGPAYRLSVYKDRLEFDLVGAPSTLQSVPLAKAARNQYRLRLYDGRIQIVVDGTVQIDVPDVQPMSGRNLLLFTKSATAAFDHLRSTPIDMVDFDSTGTGSWTPEVVTEWSIETQSSNGRWKAVTPPSSQSRANLGWKPDDFGLATLVDLTNAPGFGVTFRTQQSAAPAEGYELQVSASGQLTLLRNATTGPATTLGTATVTGMNASAVGLRLVVEGSTIVVFIDGSPALQVDDPGSRIPRGGVALVTEPGTTYFDDLRVEVQPNRLPISRFLPFTGPGLPLGFTLELGDGDGFGDFKGAQLLYSQGGPIFGDITFVLIPQFGIFAPSVVPGDKKLQFRLNLAVPFPAGVKLRLVVTDRAGNVRTADVTL